MVVFILTHMTCPECNTSYRPAETFFHDMIAEHVHPSLIHPNDSGDSFPSTNTGPSGSATLGKLPTVQGRLEPHFPWAH